MPGYSLDINPLPTVNPIGAPSGDFEHIQANPDMFGGAIARALQGFGGAVEKASDTGFDVASQKQRLTQEISASETNTWLAKAVTDKFNDFGRLQGRAAQDKLPQFKNDIEDLYNQSLKNAGDSLFMKAALAKSGRYITDAYYRYGTQHADSQWRQWQTKTADDRASELGSQAGIAAQHGTWDNVGTFLHASDDEVAKKFEAQGWKAEDYAAEVQKNRGKNVRTIVETLAANGDVRTAQAVLEKYQTGMDATSRLSAMSHIKGQVAQIQGRDDADEASGHKWRSADVVGSTVSAWKNQGMSPNGVAGILFNIKEESGFYPALRHPDQPNWSGEAHYAHGLYQEGGEEWNRYEGWLRKNHAGADWRDPQLQSEFAAWNLKTNYPDTWARMNAAATPQDAAAIYAKEYLKPSEANLQSRLMKIYGGRGLGPPESYGNIRAPLVPKDEAYERILASNNDDPVRQNAGIARLNLLYSLDRSEQTQNRVLFNQRVNDTTTEAMTRGTATNPLTEDDFLRQGKTSADYDDYQDALTLGADLQGAASLAPAQRAALVPPMPEPGPGYARAFKRREQFIRSIDGLEKEFREDPAAYAVRRLPDVQAAAQGMATAESGPQTNPEAVKAARANFADVMRDEQVRLGADPSSVQILSKDAVQAINKRFGTIADNDDPNVRKSLIDNIVRESNLWGNAWPDIVRQLAPQTQPIVRAIAAGADPAAMTRLLDMPKDENPVKILKEQSETKYGDVQRELNDAFTPLRRSMVGRQMDRDYPGYYGLAEKLSALYVRDGDGASAAATKAFNALIGNQFEFRDTYRIPKSVNVPADAVQAGVVAARDAIRGGGLNVAPFADDIALGAGNRADSFSKFARDGRWVTSPRNDGLNLIYDGSSGARPVRTSNGSVFFLSWQQLAALGTKHGDANAPDWGQMLR